MSQRLALTLGCILAIASASCGHKAEPKYCSTKFGADTQALAEAGKQAEEHWSEIKGDTKKLDPKKLKPFKDQCDSYFKTYDANSTCVNALDGSIVSPLELKKGCEFVEKAFQNTKSE